jgi:hypothetical protein
MPRLAGRRQGDTHDALGLAPPALDRAARLEPLAPRRERVGVEGEALAQPRDRGQMR